MCLTAFFFPHFILENRSHEYHFSFYLIFIRVESDVLCWISVWNISRDLYERVYCILKLANCEVVLTRSLHECCSHSITGALKENRRQIRIKRTTKQHCITKQFLLFSYWFSSQTHMHGIWYKAIEIPFD